MGTGIAFPVVMAPIASSRDTNCEVLECPVYGIAVTSFFLGPSMVLIGMGLLIKRRKLRQRREAVESLLIVPRGNGLALSGRF